MLVDKKEFELARVERITKVYDSSSRVIEEQWEFYYPKEELSAVGFKDKKKYGSQMLPKRSC